MATSNDSFSCADKLQVSGKTYKYYNLKKAANKLGIDLAKMPNSMKILFENLLRFEDGKSVLKEDIEAIAAWIKNKSSDKEIAFRPTRVLMQDFTGVPAVVDLAAMRDAMKALGGDPEKINPLNPVDLVIDHSVQVDSYGSNDSFKANVEIEMMRNFERYQFLRWGQKAFNNFRVVPPGTGICHQVNLEYLAKVVWTKDEEGQMLAYPDTVVGTDSHTTMINGLSVLGWGVGGIEAEAAMLGQPISMLIPEVIGFKLSGSLKEGVTATDLVLTITNMLRKKGVVGKFVEFYGPGLNGLALADRATIANMAPEYGATCGYFPIDEETIKYLKLSGRDDDLVALVEVYAKEQGLWRAEDMDVSAFTDSMELDLASVKATMAGPKRPQDKILLTDIKSNFIEDLKKTYNKEDMTKSVEVVNADYKIGNGDVVLAAITSCTNTSNPSVMLAAGLVARNAAKLGLKTKPWVKTSLAPGSQVVTEYYNASGLMPYLEQMGFNLVGYGCTTCIGNSGPLKAEIEDAIGQNDLVVASVLSGNRNFEGRIHPFCKANYLASPPLVVAYAIAGTVNINLETDPIAQTADGNDVYLRDIWPSNAEINDMISKFVTPEMYRAKYANVFAGDKAWQGIPIKEGQTYEWNQSSTYIANPPYFEGMKMELPQLTDVKGAKCLAVFGDSITTDHISPAGNISKSSPAASYLQNNKVTYLDFNSYGARRGNHEVMMRGTFANIRIKNEMLAGTEGGVTTYLPTGETMSIFDAAMKYKQAGMPLVIVAGKEYGTGSSRDWAAKGTLLLGVKAVIAESFERIHRSNLIGMGILPLEFMNGENRKTLNLKGTETYDLVGFEHLNARMKVTCNITYADGNKKSVQLQSRLDTEDEVSYMKNGGILHNVLRGMMK